MPTVNVNRGGMKKKSQISALNSAAMRTGTISRNIARIETVTRSINATTRYPIRLCSDNPISETDSTITMLIRNCRLILGRLKRNVFNSVLMTVQK